MSGLKTEIIESTTLGSDGLCLDQYPDGSVRLICDEELQGLDKNTGVMQYKRRAFVQLSKKEMMFLISTYLQNELEWGSLTGEETNETLSES